MITADLGGLPAKIVAYPKMVLAGFALGTGLLGAWAPSMKIDASADTLLTKGNADYIRTQVVNRRFSPEEFLIIAYAPKDGGVFSARSREDLRTLSKKLRAFPRVAAVRGMLDVPIFERLRGQSSVADSPRHTVAEGDFSPEELRRAFSGHPIYEDLIINASQTATGLQVTFKKDPVLERLYDRIVALREKSLTAALGEKESAELARLEGEAEPIESELNKTRNAEIAAMRALLPDYEKRAAIYVGGVHVLGFQLIEIIKNDLVVFGAAVTGTIAVVLFLLFGRVLWVVLPLACAACAIACTMGLFGLLGLKTTVISSSFISLQLVLTLAIVMHLIVQYREYAREYPDWNQEKLIERTLVRKIPPCFYASATTSIGFGSLLFSGLQPVISFGWMMIIAMCFSTGVSLVVFPAAMALFKREPTAPAGMAVLPMLKASAALTLRRPGVVFSVCAASTALFLWGLFLLDVENSFIDYFRDSTQVHRELSFIDREFGGSTPLDIVYTIPESERAKGLVLTAKAVSTAQRVAQSLRGHKGVGKTLSIVEFTELGRKINNDRPLTEYELSAFYHLVDDSLRNDLLGSFISADHAQLRFSARIQDTTPGLRRADLLAEIRSGIEAIGIPPDRYTTTSLFVLYQDILQQLYRSQILILGIVYAVLALTFLAIFRSLRIALIGIVPNVLTTLAVLGIMGLAAVPLDIMTITISSIAMGIAVDNTIHYMHRYLEELRDGSPERAVEKSHLSVGRAMLYTTLVITIGFSMLVFSNFMPSVLFGLLTGLAMTVALLADMTLLPALLRAFVPKAP